MSDVSGTQSAGFVDVYGLELAGWDTHPTWSRSHRTIGGRCPWTHDRSAWSARTFCGHTVPGDAASVPEPTSSTCPPCWTATPDDVPGPWTVLVSVPDSRTALRLTPGGGLTRRRVHAAQIVTRSRAQRLAGEITADPQQPGVTARAAHF